MEKCVFFRLSPEKIFRLKKGAQQNEMNFTYIFLNISNSTFPINTLTVIWMMSLIFPIFHVFELHNHSFLMLTFSHMSFSLLFFFHFQWHCTVMILIIEKQTKTFSKLSYQILFPILWEGIILKFWNTFVWIYFDSFWLLQWDGR